MIKIIKIFFGSLILIGITTGCNDSIISSPAKYVAFLKENSSGITDSITIEGLIISIKFVPPELLALNSYGSEKFKSNYDEIIKGYKDMEYYEYNLYKPDQKTTDYLKNLNAPLDTTDFAVYLNFNIQNDFQLAIGKDTFPCLYLHREISEAITNRIKYTLAFPVIKNSNLKLSDRSIILNSNTLGLKKIKLTILSNEIELLPQLKIK